MTSELNVDVSNLQPNFTRQQLDALYDYGIRCITVGCQYPGNGSGNAREKFATIIQDGRFHIDAYFESQRPEYVWPFIQQFAPYVRTWYVAYELVDYSGVQDEDTLDDWLEQADRLTGKLTGIYTSRYMWDMLGMDPNYAKFSNRPLGNAYYDEAADGFTLPRPFGGWSERVWDQYSGNGYIPGIPYEIDLGAVNLDEYSVAPSPVAVGGTDMQEVSMTMQQKIALGVALGGDDGIFSKHFSDLVNLDVSDGYNVTLGTDPTNDIVIFRMPKGTIPVE